MTELSDSQRRALLYRLAIGLSLAPVAAFNAPAHGADLPLLSEKDPDAKAQAYVEDASRAKGATPGALCSNCSIYGGPDGAAAGPCTLFPGKAAGWCKAWSGL
jgi:hypothetical protein